MTSIKKEKVRTQNQRRELGAFTAPPKTRVFVPQDVFLQNNKYLMDKVVEPPRSGSCQGQDTSLWFPISNNGVYGKANTQKQRMAIDICRECPVKAECLMYSLEYEPFGIWGGLPESARALLARFWKIENKRTWCVRPSFLKYRKVVDYIVHPTDIKLIKDIAREQNLAQPPFNERAGLSATAQRRVRLGLADTTS